MGTYVLHIAGAVLLSAIVTAIAPGGGVGKLVRGVTRLLILAVMIAPVISLLGKAPASLSASSQLGEDTSYLTACARMLEADDARDISVLLEEEFSCECTVTVSRRAEADFPRIKISVILSQTGIIGQDEHINMIEQIEALLVERYDCEVEVS